MTEVEYFDGAFLRLDCGHRIWEHRYPDLLKNWLSKDKKFDVELECPMCKLVKEIGDGRRTD